MRRAFEQQARDNATERRTLLQRATGVGEVKQQSKMAMTMVKYLSIHRYVREVRLRKTLRGILTNITDLALKMAKGEDEFTVTTVSTFRLVANRALCVDEVSKSDAWRVHPIGAE